VTLQEPELSAIEHSRAQQARSHLLSADQIIGYGTCARLALPRYPRRNPGFQTNYFGRTRAEVPRNGLDCCLLRPIRKRGGVSAKPILCRPEYQLRRNNRSLPNRQHNQVLPLNPPKRHSGQQFASQQRAWNQSHAHYAGPV
jgi:hypothetical protein